MLASCIVKDGQTTTTAAIPFASGIKADDIDENTVGDGVTIDGVLLKDSEVTTDTINEKTSDTGVTVDGVLLKDSTAEVTEIRDTNGNKSLKITATASAVNELTIVNAATGDAPEIKASGGDTNISIKLTPKGTGTIQDATGPIMPVGAVLPYAGTTAPAGWLFCYGQDVSRTTYAALFTAISTTYGVGDGSTTFNVPDLRGRVVAGKDDMGGTSANRLTDQSGGLNGDTLGDTGGAETHTLVIDEMPAHTHTLSANAILNGGGAGFGDFNTPSTNKSTGSAGGGGAHNNVQPTIILNYIIKT
ncbi:MAG: tail fiber protein [Anaerolineae bacterium]|nr:tail fiber protein [Anaerolineae bacterium]